ncbi:MULTISPECIES: bifunctional 4-hydroxy-2-oxoglutarate aldolase/2-dehydro-3-deoxy-phosphogluconate aldolase [unclassified Enterococcus]|uniref:bifunctional 4-hydroxy-2-oxoglutarate aldolase/2-dehydro-3-deoxy-phosphogluconate aldolase n=1 Tax=unclassified Enterococcus TaxID=2608891 RepID=UPI001555E8A1|nr:MULTISPECIES: bifunctional 4-hydroxy-2-oxoglutarate aldolase/2-dehydro-3-deoxy-phosphogluconate aldolase [unclassified Enterococcus]MBS7577667.1 bifunctional 4-hydroxy-2-oxoglutarate aldolase/2-dehydro-3-deoxy-phosphogluconate aldolase [Enterococcus sp. MMGLQ5-2]MBS7584139.1 bifunctional 4-hydroxy-2-oxoglutarate aldolase/2-dehydro-3-deoxy-phosphogluconate aldolase [Enterococcus sp. MMGLQ5-1]NPD11997.1 bifunctional 4-hydroxy-2-oxoglutarate aldolase/2-dehydro-3-deoxy-phosphogluconate aldolase [
MKKMNILSKLKQIGVIAVVRGATADAALNSSDAIIAGGMKGIELTFTVPNADQAIAKLVEKYRSDSEVVIGAGTVLDAVTARLAIMAGAEFIVSPTFDLETAEICNLYQIPYLPGCMTITEIKTALKAGVDIIKLFPGNAFGPSIISAFKAPLPQLNIMPTGGVSLDNLEDWFKAGVVAVGVGGNLLKPAETGDYEAVTAVAKQYVDKYRSIQGV